MSWLTPAVIRKPSNHDSRSISDTAMPASVGNVLKRFETSSGGAEAVAVAVPVVVKSAAGSVGARRRCRFVRQCRARAPAALRVALAEGRTRCSTGRGRDLRRPNVVGGRAMFHGSDRPRMGADTWRSYRSEELGLTDR